MSLPLFPVTTVGSMPRSDAVANGLRERKRGAMTAAEFNRLADEAVRSVLDLQIAAGVDIVTDGEQRRDNFYSFVADKLDGVQLMSLSEMLDVVDDKDAFERLLETLDVPAYAINNPTCVAPIRRREALAVDEVTFVKQHTDRPVKVALPGPYILTRALWVPEVARAAYESKEALGDVVVSILREEVTELIEAGTEFIQFDEPVLTELVFSTGSTRTFMCAALATRNDPAEELAFAAGLLHRVLDGFAGQTRFGMHVCRGNWSRDESTLLRGNFSPLRTFFEQSPVQQLVLEYATERAGELVPLEGKEIGLGVVNPRTDTLESPEQISSRVKSAMEHFAPGKIFLNPDCGFGTFAARPMNEWAMIEQKLRNMVAAATALRKEMG